MIPGSGFLYYLPSAVTGKIIKRGSSILTVSVYLA